MANLPVKIGFGRVVWIRYFPGQAALSVFLHHSFDIVCVLLPHLCENRARQNHVASHFWRHLERYVLVGSNSGSAV